MKARNLFQTASLALASTCVLHPAALFAQGSLTPPGAPAPTMKTLAQIEPRTPISAAPFTISAPGSYYLTANVTVTNGNGIMIAANGVTLDLNGFTISSTSPNATGFGIQLASRSSDITIFNGHIRGGVTNNGAGAFNGPGFEYGIGYYTDPPVNVRVTGVSVSGCYRYGIILYYGNSTLVDACTVRTIGVYGILAATVRSSQALDCGSTAVSGEVVSDCRGESYGYGGHAVNATVAQNCYGASILDGHGVNAWTALNCVGSSSSGTGLRAAYTAQNCYGVSSSGYGLISVIAIGCRAQSTYFPGLSATLANSCLVSGAGSSITYKYNMP